MKNTSLQDELLSEKTANVVFAHRISLLEKQCEYATASAASSLFSRFSQHEFKELAIRINQENHELISELFQTMDDIFETYIAFGKMSVVLED